MQWRLSKMLLRCRNCLGLPHPSDNLVVNSPTLTASSAPSPSVLELIDVKFLSGEPVPVKLDESDYEVASLQRRIGDLLTIPSSRVVLTLSGEILEEHRTLDSVRSTITAVIMPSDEDQLSALIQELTQQAGNLLAACDYTGAQQQLEMVEHVYTDDGVQRLVALLSQLLHLDRAFRRTLLGDAARTANDLRKEEPASVAADLPDLVEDLLNDLCELLNVPTALADLVECVVADARSYIEILSNLMAVHRAVQFTMVERFLAPSAVIKRLRNVHQEASKKAGTSSSFAAALRRLASEAELLGCLLIADFKTSLLKGVDAFVQLAQAERLLAQLVSISYNLASSGAIRWYTRFHSHCIGRLLLLCGGGLKAAAAIGPNQIIGNVPTLSQPRTGPKELMSTGVRSDRGITGVLQFNLSPKPYLQDLQRLAAVPGVACVGIFVNARQLPHLESAKQLLHSWREPFQDGSWLLVPPETAEHSTSGSAVDSDCKWWVLAFASAHRSGLLQDSVSELDHPEISTNAEAWEAWQNRNPKKLSTLRQTLSQACGQRHRLRCCTPPSISSSQPQSPHSPVRHCYKSEETLQLSSSAVSLVQGGIQTGSLCDTLSNDIEVNQKSSECLLGLTLEMPMSPHITQRPSSANPDSSFFRCLVMPLDIGTFRSPLFLGLVEQDLPTTSGARSPPPGRDKNLVELDSGPQWWQAMKQLYRRQHNDAGTLKSEDGPCTIERELVALAAAISGRQLRTSAGMMGEAESKLPCGSALSAYLLTTYGSGETPANLPPSYETGHGCLGHTSTGVIVRCPPIQITPTGKNDIVLYHYTDLAGFAAITGQKKMKHLRASFAERAHFGDGIYTSQHPPDFFGSKERILLNNYTNASNRDKQLCQIQGWRDKGVVDYCVPIVVSRDKAVNVSVEKTREMTQVGHTLHHGPMRKDRDIWVVVVAVDGRVKNGCEDLDSVYCRLASCDFSMRQDAVEILAGHAGMGDARATRAICQSLHDDNFNVRIAAVWALAGARSLTPAKREREITKLAQAEPVEAVLEAVKDALTFLDAI